MLLFTRQSAVGAAFAGLLGLGIGLAPASASRQQPIPEITVRALRGGVHLLEGMGGNVAVLAGDDGVLVVDDQMAPIEKQLLAAIDGVSKAPWRFVLNTHHHGDHTGNNPSFGARAPIVAHANVRTRLADPKGKNGAMAAAGLPMVTFEDSLELHLAGQDVRVRHFANAHTDGDSVVFFRQANVAHLGDLFFNGRFPVVDLDSGGSVRGVVNAVDEILALLDDDVQLIPGHGPLATKAELSTYRDVLNDCLKLVGDAQRAGKSLEQMQRERVLSKYEQLAWKVVGEERFLSTVARELGVK